MSYSLTLSPHELHSLAWATDRGYCPEELYDALYVALRDAHETATGEEILDNYSRTPYTVTVPEHVAWSITDHREHDPDSLWACIGGDLLERLLDLEEAVV